jgi:mRNA-decapping enzyme subunit 2
MEVGTGATPSIVIPDPAPTSHPVDIGTEGGVGLGASASATEGKSPVDKTFLLGFLEDVARRGR